MCTVSARNADSRRLRELSNLLHEPTESAVAPARQVSFDVGIADAGLNSAKVHAGECTGGGPSNRFAPD